MSSWYRSLSPIPYSQLIDGRLTKFGVRIEIPTNTANDRRCLVGRDGVLWVYRLDDGSCSFGRFAGSLPFSVLNAIQEEFETEVVNHHDYRYWGYRSEEEMEADYAKLSKEDEDEFYKNVICYVRGEPHGLGSRTIGMIMARIAKAVVERKSALVAPENRDEFLKIVEDIYSSDARKWGRASETNFNDLMQKELNRRLSELSSSTIEASTGPEFEDDAWYAGIGKAEDDEIERNLEAPLDGSDCCTATGRDAALDRGLRAPPRRTINHESKRRTDSIG